MSEKILEKQIDFINKAMQMSKELGFEIIEFKSTNCEPTNLDICVGIFARYIEYVIHDRGWVQGRTYTKVGAEKIAEALKCDSIKVGNLEIEEDAKQLQECDVRKFFNNKKEA
tara:strand:- start:997 stop:1335 length:339 start_codon:yes stop_codon:yes gene_type:complete